MKLKKRNPGSQEEPTEKMSKLSPALKALINAPFAKPNTLPATPKIYSVYESIHKEAQKRNVGQPAWLSFSVRGACLPIESSRLTRRQTAATMTMNSPESLTALYNLATENSKNKAQSVKTAELMREVGLKCIGFNGVCFLLYPSIKNIPNIRLRSHEQSMSSAPSAPPSPQK